MTIDLNNLVNTVIVPIMAVAFPVSVIFALTERFANMFLSFVRGDKHVKL